jgi:hypothetical protein
MWLSRSVIAIRSKLPPEEILRRVTNHVGERAALETAFAGSADVVEGSVGDSTFTIRYRYGSSLYDVHGRILERPTSRLVIFRCQRRPSPWWALVLGCTGGATFYYGGGKWTAFYGYEHPTYWALTAAAALLTGLVLPRIGWIPSTLLTAVGDHFSRMLVGELE